MLSPLSMFLDAETRKAMGEQAVVLSKAVGYSSAGQYIEPPYSYMYMYMYSVNIRTLSFLFSLLLTCVCTTHYSHYTHHTTHYSLNSHYTPHTTHYSPHYSLFT